MNRLACCIGLLGVLAAAPALADDLADEADLQFRVGAERYLAQDYRGALEHFLASNRLVKNRNVTFNIARTYEKLALYPEAFRYYAAALVGEQDADTRARILLSIQQIRPHVAVLAVDTEPPGAAIYIDREDLGARGESPVRLGLPAGHYRVIATLPGYYPADAVVDAASVGAEQSVHLDLRPILGRVRIEGDAVGARVRIDSDAGVPRCVVPCTLDLPPGNHVLHLSQDGHRNADVPVNIVARGEVLIRPRLDEETGAVVLTTDEPGALILVDGRSRGFTPLLLSLPVGRHHVELTLPGFRPSERVVDIAKDRQARIDVQMLRAEEVQAASRSSELVDDAPSSVTIIPREELLAFGYPTIGDAVRGVRGLYVWNDRSYSSIGVRGLGRLGSYTNRELVLADGHPTNDDWVGSAYVGYDARTDLADVERIEVVRGPGSVLYGTNAFSGVINVVSRGTEGRSGGDAGVSAAGSGVGRARVRGQLDFGKDGGLWLSAAGAHGEGRDFYFPELRTGTAPGEDGNARSVDGFSAGTVQGHVTWKSLSAQWFLHSHEKHLPTGAFDTILGDPRTRQRDTRGFVELRVEPVLGKSVQLLSRVHANLYAFRGEYARTADESGVEKDTYDGRWIGAEQRVVITPSDRLRLTLGAEGQYHFRVDATARDDSGIFLDESGKKGRSYEVGAAYALADARVNDRVRVSAGARLDAYSTFGSAVNPRVAVVLRPYDRGNLKIIGSRAFRAPSVYELYYNDGGTTQVASPDLSPEYLYSLEIEHSHRLSSTLTGLVAVYANYATDLIVSRGAGTERDPLYYVNSSSPVSSLGGEIAIRREWRQGIMLQASYGFQHSRYLVSDSLGDLVSYRRDPAYRNVENSPEHLASVKAAVPILSRGLTAATRLTFEGPRYDRYESVDDEPQQRTDPAVVWDLMLSGHEDRFDLRYSFGVYNVTNYRYALPVSNELAQRFITQDGRTFLASVDVRF